MAKKPKTPPGKLVVTAKRPRIVITKSRRDALVRLIVPGYGRRPLALAHGIVSAMLADLSDEQWSTLTLSRVQAGDTLMTCTTADVRLATTFTCSPSAADARLSIVGELLQDCARRACAPLGGPPTHEVALEVA